MTPKEKAESLLHQYKMLLMNEDTECGNEIIVSTLSKKCALIAVDDIINLVKKYETEKGRLLIDNIRLQYWQQVKQEIEKL